jgi:hypothetical protein
MAGVEHDAGATATMMGKQKNQPTPQINNHLRLSLRYFEYCKQSS